MNGKMVIPFETRERILKALQIPHNGIDKSRVAARQLYYRPKMKQQIRQLIKSWDVYQRFWPSHQHEPLMITESYQAIDADGAVLFHYNEHNYIDLVDQLSRFLTWHRVEENFNSLGHYLEAWLVLILLIPHVIRTDAGPQYWSEFKQFCIKHEIKHVVSPPLHP